MLFCSLFIFALTAVQLIYAASDNFMSNSASIELGAYLNGNSKDVCDGDELEMLTICASEIVGKLNDCKSDDLACECLALQSMKRQCYGLCPNTASGSFLVVLYDNCETMNDFNPCKLSPKKHDAQVAKVLEPDVSFRVDEKEPDFTLRSVVVNGSCESTLISHLDRTQQTVDSNQSNTTTYHMTEELPEEEENGAGVLQCGLPTVLQSILAIFMVLSLAEFF